MNLPNNTFLKSGNYKIVRYISSGGFGYTYEAIDTTSGYRVAIKELFVKNINDRDDDFNIKTFSSNNVVLFERIKKKFIEEASALYNLSHPNIVKVFDYFEENSTAYYVMDYIEGKSLQTILDEGMAIPETDSRNYIATIAKALDYVHTHNRLHLDIKPANIMINKLGTPILIDFGVSKQYDEVDGSNTSTLMGYTKGYAPLEQIGNNLYKFTTATDIYALGATLFHCVTGCTPPDASDILNYGLPTLPNHLYPSTIRTITEAMKPMVNERTQNIFEFQQNLANNSPYGVNIPTPPGPVAQEPPRKPKSFLWVIVAILAVCFVVMVGIYANSSDDQSDITPVASDEAIVEGEVIGDNDVVEGKVLGENDNVIEDNDEGLIDQTNDSQSNIPRGAIDYFGNMIHKGKKYPFYLKLNYNDGKVVSGHYINASAPNLDFPVQASYEGNTLVLSNDSKGHFYIKLNGDYDNMRGWGKQDGYPEQEVEIFR